MKSIAIFVTTIESKKSVIGWPVCCGNPLITDCGPGGRNNNLIIEHWHGVIDVTVFPYRSCTEATTSQISVAGRTGGCQNDNFQYSRWW